MRHDLCLVDAAIPPLPVTLVGDVGLPDGRPILCLLQEFVAPDVPALRRRDRGPAGLPRAVLEFMGERDAGSIFGSAWQLFAAGAYRDSDCVERVAPEIELAKGAAGSALASAIVARRRLETRPA